MRYCLDDVVAGQRRFFDTASGLADSCLRASLIGPSRPWESLTVRPDDVTPWPFTELA